MKQKTESNGETNNSTIIVGDFSIPLSIMDRTFRQKAKETRLAQLILSEIYHFPTRECRFFDFFPLNHKILVTVLCTMSS